MTGYSLGVNGENQTKLKDKSQVRCSEEALCHSEVAARRSEEEAG